MIDRLACHKLPLIKTLTIIKQNFYVRDQNILTSLVNRYIQFLIYTLKQI